MSRGLTAAVKCSIHAPAEKVWQALTDPAIIRQYFFGTNVTSDWKKGSSITWAGEWEGRSYLEKGEVLEAIPNKRLAYTYLSSMSGLEDKPENYNHITIDLVEKNGVTDVALTQDNNATEEGRAHSESNWNHVLQAMRELLEKKS